MKKSIFLALAASLVTSGAFAQATGTTSSTTTTTTAAPIPTAPAASEEVGVSSRDGITVSGADVMMTRNGVTEKVTKEVELSNGYRVQPDGTILTRDGGTIRLRASQVLGFDGRFIEAPIKESAAPNATSTTTVVTPAPSTTTVVTPPSAATTTVVTPAPAATQQAADEAARVEAQRRAEGLNKGPIKAGEGVQK